MALILPPRLQERLEQFGRNPLAYMEIESAGQSAELTSEADWHGSTTLTNVDHDTPPPPAGGDVILAVDTASYTSSSLSPPTSDITTDQWSNTIPAFQPYYSVIDENPADDADYIVAVRSIVGTTVATFRGACSMAAIISQVPDNAHIRRVRVYARGWWTGYLPGVRTLSGIISDGTTHDYATAQAIPDAAWTNFNFYWATNPFDSSNPWTKETLSDITNVGVRLNFGTGTNDSQECRCSQLTLIVEWYDFQATGSLVTSTFDIGASAVTDNQAVVSINDRIPTNAGLTYTIEGSNIDWSSAVSLGSVVDGTKVTGYRYYRVTASFTSDGTVTAVLKSIRIDIPDNIYRFTTLLIDGLESKPLIKAIPGRTIELNMKDFITVGSNLAVKLARTDYVDEMIRGNYFRGLRASIYLSVEMDNLTINDMLDYYSGLVVDYKIMDVEVEIYIKDASKNLTAKVPEGTKPSTSPSMTYDGAHLVDVVADYMEKANIQSRNIDTASLSTVKANVGDGSPAAVNYLTYRGGSPPEDPGATWDTTITESQPAGKPISEVLGLLGSYLVALENGRLTLIEYDASTAAEEPWTHDDFVKKSKPSYRADLEHLRNWIVVYYDWDGLGDDIDNYHSILIDPDDGAGASIENWGITEAKIIKSKWLAGDSTDGYYGDVLATHIAARELARLKDGMGIFKCKTNLDKCGIQVGDFITINSPLIINPEVGLGDTRKFMATKKTWQVSKGFIDWVLVEAQ